MEIALLGAGMMGAVIARDLATWNPPEAMRVGDLDGERAEKVAGLHGFGWSAVDVNEPESLDRFLAGCDVVVNAVQYQSNLAVMEGAFRVGSNYLDLGGLFHTTRRQLEFDRWFRTGGLTAVLGMGSCPGIANVHAGDLGGRLDTVRSVMIYNGSTVDPPGTFRWPYSISTILDEIAERPVVFTGGRFEERDPLSGEEVFSFLDPIGEVTTHLSLHSEVATIPLSLAEKGIEECAFRIRFFGMPEDVVRELALLAQLGLASNESRRVGEVEVVPRRLLVDLLEEHSRRSLPPEGEGQGAEDSTRDDRSDPGFKDIATVVQGTRSGKPVTLRIDTTAWPSAELGVSGGGSVVAAPAAIVARWLAERTIDRPGVHPPERIVPPQPFYEALALRGIETTHTED